MSPEVKLVYVCHPSNPTGATLTEGELSDICEIASRFGAYVISDEIYRGLEWEGGISPSVVNFYERGVTTSSLSKTLGMSGLRIGWLATQDRDFLERCMDLKYYISLHQQSRLDEVVAMAAFQPDKYWNLVGRTMAAAKVNYDITSDGCEITKLSMGAAQRRFSFVSELRSGYFVLGFVRALLEKPYRTYILPGSCYGVEKHVRLGFGPGTPAENMRAGLGQISAFVAACRSGVAHRIVSFREPEANDFEE